MEIISLFPPRARKSNNYCYLDGWNIDNFRQRNQEKKQRTDNKNDAKNIKNGSIRKVQYCYRNNGKKNNNLKGP